MNNSDILYLYDARMCNPNGDPDNNNKPRIDEYTNTNLVSDLRLKRYSRDYALIEGKDIFVRNLDGLAVMQENILKADGVNLDDATVIDETAEGKGKKEKGKKKEDLKDIIRQNNMCKEYIDVRLFGAAVAVKKKTTKVIGPVQFSWGYSLNPVELNPSCTITTHFSSSKDNDTGSIGKDYRLYYSLIAFSGVISGRRAAHTFLSDEDVTFLDNSMKYAIPLLTTRSKFGQWPRLYMRVEYNDSGTVLKDLRDYISLDAAKLDEIRSTRDYTVNIDKLVDYLKENFDKIDTIHYFADSDLKLTLGGKHTTFEKAFAGFNLAYIK